MTDHQDRRVEPEAAITREAMKAIIEREEPSDALFLDECSRHDDAVVFEPRKKDWAVYLTSERAWPIDSTYRIFATESEALPHMLKKLRQSAAARRGMDALRARHDRGLESNDSSAEASGVSARSRPGNRPSSGSR